MRDLRLVLVPCVLFVVVAGWWLIGSSSSQSAEDLATRATTEASTSSLLSSGASAAPATTTTSTTTTTTTTTEPPPVRTNALYVSPDGIDRPDGGWVVDEPLRTPDYAVSVSREGDTVFLLPGDYGPLTIAERRGLRVTAPEGGVTLSSGSYDDFAAVLIEDSVGIEIDGLRTTESLWGIRVVNSTRVVLRDNDVVNTGQEAIHILELSEDVLVEGNRIDGTGLRPGGNGEFAYADFGEGVYLGTGGFLDGGILDTVSGVSVIGNTIANTTAEAVEIKAGVSDVLVSGNRIHDVEVHSGGAVSIGRGEFEYDADVVVEANAIWNVSTRNPWADGIGVRVSATAIVRDNVIFDTQHFGIRVDDELRHVEGVVEIEGNLIFRTGQAPYFDESAGSGVPVSESGTLSGDAALELLSQLGMDASSPDVDTLLDFLQAN